MMAFVSDIIMTPVGTKTLVTGATGFLGRRLCERLQAQGEHLIGCGRNRQEGPWVDFIEADLAGEGLPEESLEGVGTIYHLASKAHAVAETSVDLGSYRPVIVDGTRRLTKSAIGVGVGRFVYVSSVKAMGEGNPDGQPLEALNESVALAPQTPYGLAKAEAEKIVLKSGIPHVVVLRPAMVFGRGEKGNLPRMVEAVRNGRFPPLPDTGNRRSMVHVDDVVEYLIRSATTHCATGQVYILAHNEALSTRKLYDEIRRALGLEQVKFSVPLILLKVTAAFGTALGNLTGKRLPLDLDTLNKLTGSAWYSPALVEKDLDYKAQHSVVEWLNE